MKFNQKLIQIVKFVHIAVCMAFVVSCASISINTDTRRGAGADVSINTVPGISDEKLNEIELNYGELARQRVEDWRYLIADNQTEKAENKLVLVNDFINQLRFKDDEVHWQQADYWATPIETLVTNGGDCEDFSLAKYVTLSELGLAEQCLRLTYVKAISINKAHMVLTYQCQPGDIPFVLDNLTELILPADQRTDLLPVYSFNAKGLWIAKQKGMGKKVGNKERNSLWTDFLKRFEKEKILIADD